MEADRTVVLPPMLHPSGRDGFYGRRAELRRDFAIPPSAMLAVSVAVYPKRKGLDRSIAALRDLPGLHLLVVGLRAKDAVSARTLAAKHGVEARTCLLGHRDDVADILGAADLMLNPARVDNTGLIIVESLLAGVPVVATAACGFSEYIERFGAGIVVAEPFDPAAYVAAIRTAIEPHTLAELKSRARDSAPRLSAEGGLERILDAIEEVLRRRAARRAA